MLPLLAALLVAHGAVGVLLGFMVSWAARRWLATALVLVPAVCARPRECGRVDVGWPSALAVSRLTSGAAGALAVLSAWIDSRRRAEGYWLCEGCEWEWCAWLCEDDAVVTLVDDCGFDVDVVTREFWFPISVSRLEADATGGA
jgi:hypothetical protein